MTRKFKSGDRVKINPNSQAGRVEYVGTVVDYGEYDFVLVKFDDFTNGHNGSSYYSGKGIEYDPKNRQHLYVREDVLCLLEGE